MMVRWLVIIGAGFIAYAVGREVRDMLLIYIGIIMLVEGVTIHVDRKILALNEKNSGGK